MTRINYGVHPSELPRKALLAEHREIIRIPNTIRSGRAVIQDIPDEFCLGKGHVKFFYNKLRYLKKRYDHLHRTALYRGYNVTDFSACFKLEDFDSALWTPTHHATKEGRALVIERLLLRDHELTLHPFYDMQPF